MFIILTIIRNFFFRIIILNKVILSSIYFKYFQK